MRQKGPRHWDQIYLERIFYVDYSYQNETKFLVSVIFEYQNRPDPFSDHRAGFEIRTEWRCTCIETRTHTDEERLVRGFNLIFLDEREGLEDSLPSNGVSLLSQIKVVGFDGDQTEELPPLEFGYTNFEKENRNFFSIKGHLPAHSLAHPSLALVDIFGNGLPDILELNSVVRYFWLVPCEIMTVSPSATSAGSRPPIWTFPFSFAMR